MYRLPSIILIVFGVMLLRAQSPHGESFKVNCAACHNPSGWTSIRDTLQFNHDTTNFPLEGMHAQIDCKGCHADLVFAGTSSECVDCHTDMHQMSVGNDCARCHTPQSWLVDNIPELHEQVGLPLTGAHSTLNCVDCHISETNLRFDRIGNDCINCHNDDYLRAKKPDHVAGGISTNCIECHDPLMGGWNTNFYNHDFFPLVLGHDIRDCRQCHTRDDFSGASPSCVSCHQDDYQATDNPNHTDLMFSTECKDCHNIGSWVPSSYDHSIYPLQGAHASVDCNSCHHGDYTNTPNTCVGCHLNDYNNTTNPNHNAAQFSTDCTQCHNENAWKPATFDHDADYFPIYSGRHDNEWNQCSDCHTNSSDYSVFSCIDCHAHNNPNSLSREHDEVSNYTYDSNACYNCHPDGRE